ncbi:hypothetical protein [Pollutibacter soli]|uniref:hypothetical protein n=1 Tax=Pollutibacter soli TaxID=3034157 RepID=UPI0030138068
MPTFQTEIRITDPDDKIQQKLNDYLHQHVTIENQSVHHLTNELATPLYLRFETKGGTISELTKTVAEAVRETGRKLSFTIIRHKN